MYIRVQVQKNFKAPDNKVSKYAQMLTIALIREYS